MSNLVTFEDLAKMKKEILGQSAPASIVKEVAASTKFRRMFNADMSLGRALTGGQFIDTVSIQDGAVTADKLIATLVLSTTIIAGAESPADRLTLDSTGMTAHGTISGVPNTQYFSLNSAGWSVGVAPDQITYVNSTGVLSVPAAVITSLTIADVGSGQLGGTYTSSASDTGTRLRLSTTGLEMYNGATRTVYLNAATGAFTLSNDTGGADRITITDTGIELWKSSSRQFYLAAGGATNAITMLLTGPGVSDRIGMNPTDGFWLGADTYAGASTKFRVSPAGVLQATSATISGAITATSGTLQSLSVTGALEISASGVFRSGPTSGARTEMDASGFYQYGSASAVRARLLATGAGALGISTSYTSGVISWTTAGALTLGGFTVTDSLLSSGTGGSYVTVSSGATAFSAGGATPSSAPFHVTSGGALTATTLSAGALTITGAATFSGGSLTLPNGGTITSSVVDINGNGVGAGTFSNMSLDGDTTIVSGGRIVDAVDGSYWDSSGIVLKSSGSFGDAIKWQNGSTDKGSIYTSGSGIIVRGGSGGTTDGLLSVFPTVATLSVNSSSSYVTVDSSATNRFEVATASTIRLAISSSGNVSLTNKLYPGDSATQANVYLASGGTHMDIRLSDTAGSSGFRVLDSGGTVVWLVNSDGQMSLPGADTTAVGAYYGRVPVAFNGLTKYIALYNA